SRLLGGQASTLRPPGANASTRPLRFALIDAPLPLRVGPTGVERLPDALRGAGLGGGSLRRGRQCRARPFTRLAPRSGHALAQPSRDPRILAAARRRAR